MFIQNRKVPLSRYEFATLFLFCLLSFLGEKCTTGLKSLRQLQALAQCEAKCIFEDESQERWPSEDFPCVDDTCREEDMSEERRTFEDDHCVEDNCQECLMGIAIAKQEKNCTRYCNGSEICSNSCLCVAQEFNQTGKLSTWIRPVLQLNDASGWSKRPGNLTSPYLLCHEPNLLSVRWDPPFSGLVYVLEYSDTSDSWQPIQTTRFTTVTLVDLTPETRYQIRITGMASDGQMGEPALSEWVSTLPANVVPDTVEDIYVQHIKVKENRVTVNITWVPALDQACFYEVAAFPDNIPDYNIEEVEPQRLFTVLMDMQFNNEYNVTIRSQRRDKTLSSQPAWILYNVPTCLELHNYNISVCAPPEPVNITVRETWSPMSEPNIILYDVSVTWALPILPTDQQQINLEEIKYILTFQRKIPVAEEEKHIKTLTVPGNVSSAVFYGVDVGMVYMVSIVAQSRGGESEAINKFRQIEAFNNTLEEDKVSKWSTGKIVMIIMIPMLVLGGLTVLIVLAYNRFEKARRNKKRSNYFKDLDSSDGHSKERGVTPSPLVKDEWETCLSQLIMGDVLGEGAFGVVCKGLLQDKSREDRWHEVAVKMLKDHPLEEDVQSFQEEIKMMKSVGRHPNIVSIIGCCTQVGKMRLIVEYCSLGDLKKYLRNVWDNIVSAPYPAEVCLANATTNDLLEQVKYAELVHSDSYTPNENGNSKVINQVENKLYLNTENGDTNLPTKDGVTSAELLSFARQVAFGMEYLSANRVIHRDLAARNVLVCENKTVKISDFGMSRDIYEQNVYYKKGKGRLPVKWMAIESLTHQIYTTQSDVWSFGILLWEIVTLGGNPYPGTPTNRLFHLLKTGHRMECPNNCSKELYSLMLSCWNAKPKERPTFVELYNKLDLLLEEAIPQEYLNLDPLKVAAYLSLHSRTENTSTIISTSSTESQESLGKPDLTSSAYPMS